MDGQPRKMLLDIYRMKLWGFAEKTWGPIVEIHGLLPELSQFIEPKTLDKEKLQPFTKLTVHCRQVNTQIFQMLLDTLCEFTLIPRDQKLHSVPRIRVYGDQWRGSLGLSLRFTLFLFPVPDYGVGIDFLCNCQNHHVCESYYGGKGRVEGLGAAPLKRTIVELTATMTAATVVLPTRPQAGDSWESSGNLWSPLRWQVSP